MQGFCHHCGSAVLSAAAFCHVCGTAVPEAARAEAIHVTPHARAAAHARMGNTDDAIAGYMDIIAHQPEDADAYVALAALRLTAREGAEAESLLREALALDPTHAVAWAYLGALLLERAAVDESEEAFSVALVPGPEEFLVRLKRGEAHLRLGRTYDALQELTHAVMLPPPDIQVGAYARTLLAATRQQASRGIARTVGTVNEVGGAGRPRIEQPRRFVRWRAARRAGAMEVETEMEKRMRA